MMILKLLDPVDERRLSELPPFGEATFSRDELRGRYSGVSKWSLGVVGWFEPGGVCHSQSVPLHRPRLRETHAFTARLRPIRNIAPIVIHRALAGATRRTLRFLPLFLRWLDTELRRVVTGVYVLRRRASRRRAAALVDPRAVRVLGYDAQGTACRWRSARQVELRHASRRGIRRIRCGACPTMAPS